MWILLISGLYPRTKVDKYGTANGNQEDELIVVMYCTRNTDKEEFSTYTQYLLVHSPEKAI